MVGQATARGDRLGRPAGHHWPWQSLNFLPEPHGHGALRGVFAQSSFTTVSCLGTVWVAAAPRGPRGAWRACSRACWRFTGAAAGAGAGATAVGEAAATCS